MCRLFLHLLLVVGCAPWWVSANSTQYITLQGGGAAIPLNVNSIFSYRFVQPKVQATYSGSFSGDLALCRLLNYSKECAATDVLQPRYLDWGVVVNVPAASSYVRYPDLQVYPVTACAIIPIYNLNGGSGLVLTMLLLSKIWSGRITTWDHPGIQAINPNFTSWNVPTNQRIVLVTRADTAGSVPLIKQALGGADPTFPASVPNWNGTKVTVMSSGQALVSYVMRNPWALGFAATGDANLGDVKWAKLNRSGVIIDASSTSVQYAVLEKGLSFGNNGDDPLHLTCDLINAANPLAWPIVGFWYLAVRKSTLRVGATCDTVSALMSFWLWFWSSDEVAQLADDLGYVALPEVVREHVVARFKEDIQCGGSVVWQETEVPVVTGFGPETASPIFDKFQQAYAEVNSSVTLNYTSLASDQVDMTPLLSAGGFVVSTAPLSSSADVYSLVLGSEAVVAISNTALTLNGLTLAKILNGDITTWLHADILALNPNGIIFSGKKLNDTTQSIVLLQGPTTCGAQLTTLLRRYYPAYTGSAVQAAEKFTHETLLWSAVVGTTYSFSLTSMVGQLPTEVKMASIVSESGIAVIPSLDNASACTANATFDVTTETVTLSSGVSICYPLMLTLYVSLQRQCPPSSATARAVVFLQWMFTKDTLEAALNALNLVSLTGVSTAIVVANEEALFQLSCGVRTTPDTPSDIVPLLLAIIIPIAAVVLIGVALCGWWLWRVTENNRIMRKKFSNDNVAESCAEAIARFDLAAVAWLKEVQEPNKIQLSFLAIIALLTDVKPYIPDQLLSRLISQKDSDCNTEEDADNEAEQRSQATSPGAKDAQRSLSYSKDSVPLAPSSPTIYCTEPSGTGHRTTISSAEGAKQALAMKDWRRKRCTYMCVRFGSTYHHQERRLLTLAQIAGQIVDAAKTNGATIDAVGVDVVKVHWGVTSTSGASAVRAVQAGLEINRLRETLPEDQQAAFWLQMGIGKGVCDCGTVSSASGHCFFVVWGAEPSLAVEISMTNLPKQVLASLLVTPAVQQEVQFMVHCMPRMWHGDVLLWEPRYMLKDKEDDEWMYELEKMKDGSSLSSKILLEAFLMAKADISSAAGLSALIADLRKLHGSTMSAQDNASLDLLLVTAGKVKLHHHIADV